MSCGEDRGRRGIEAVLRILDLKTVVQIVTSQDTDNSNDSFSWTKYC